MSTTIQKSTFTYVVLHRSDEVPESLGDAMVQAYDGGMVGLEIESVTVDIPNENVSDELVALGNDGEFFDSDLEDAGYAFD